MKKKKTEEKKLLRTQEEQDELYLKAWDYDPTEEEVKAKYDDEFEDWLMSFKVD